MALKHILKHTETEAVIKCYITAATGGTVDIDLQQDLTKSTQVYAAPTVVPDETLGGFFDYTGSHVFITGLWWGLKKDKQLDVTRVISGETVHGHYYLTGAGFYEYTSFADRVYAQSNIRLVFDGPGHCIIRLRKDGWVNKVENATFGAYDNPDVVGQ